MKVLNVVKYIVTIFLVISFLFIAVMTVFGFKGYSVVTNSMFPTFKRGYAVFTKQIKFEDLQVGDIVTVRLGEDGTFTHRVVEIDRQNNEFYTKGDNSSVKDGASKAQDVLGKVVFSLPLAGYLSIIVSSKAGLACLLGVILTGIAVFKIVISIMLKKKEVTENEQAEEH